MNQKTVTIQIGNSDNKLSQAEWARFVHETNEEVRACCHDVHFFGSSDPFAPWQNAAWVVVCLEDEIGLNSEWLKERVSKVGARYNQESVAVTVGDTEFV